MDEEDKNVKRGFGLVVGLIAVCSLIHLLRSVHDNRRVEDEQRMVGLDHALSAGNVPRRRRLLRFATLLGSLERHVMSQIGSSAAKLHIHCLFSLLVSPTQLMRRASVFGCPRIGPKKQKMAS